MPQQSCNKHRDATSHVPILKSSRLGNTEPGTDKSRGETKCLEWIRPRCFSTWDAFVPLHLSVGFRGLYRLLIFIVERYSRHTDSSCSWGHWRVHTCDNRHTPHSRRHAHELHSQKHHTRAGGEHGVTLISTLHVLFWYPEDTKLWAFSALNSRDFESLLLSSLEFTYDWTHVMQGRSVCLMGRHLSDLCLLSEAPMVRDMQFVIVLCTPAVSNLFHFWIKSLNVYNALGTNVYVLCWAEIYYA